MTGGEQRVGAEAIAAKGWWRSHQWLLARRTSQLAILALFLSGPVLGWWIVKGNLAFSYTLGVLPLTDPYVLAQSLVAGHWPETLALLGAAIVLVFYGLFSGRLYCSWVCPVNMVTDAAGWLRRRFGIRRGAQLSRHTRYWVLGMTFLAALVTGTVVWEAINPVSMAHRGIIFGMGFAWAVIAAVFLFDLLVAERGWCGHVCPVGAFYGLIGSKGLLRVRAPRRAQCNNCMDCFAVCPEPQVITPVLKGPEKGVSPVILPTACTDCGRCIDVCSREVFEFGWRFDVRERPAIPQGGAQSGREPPTNALQTRFGNH